MKKYFILIILAWFVGYMTIPFYDYLNGYRDVSFTNDVELDSTMYNDCDTIKGRIFLSGSEIRDNRDYDISKNEYTTRNPIVVGEPFGYDAIDLVLKRDDNGMYVTLVFDDGGFSENKSYVQILK